MDSSVPLVTVESVELTPAGWRQVHDELSALRARRRAGGADAAGLVALDRRIGELERLLGRATLIDAAVSGAVGPGSRVAVRWDDGETERFQLVPPAEAAPRAGRISYASPAGRALVGRRIGEAVTVPGAGGDTRLEVLAVDPSAAGLEQGAHADAATG